MENVIRILSKSVGRTLYVCLRRNELMLRHIESGHELAAKSDVEFSNSRLLVANTTLVTSMIKRSMRTILARFGIAPTIVMHPLEMVEGGLSEVEEKTLTEIGYAVGAVRVVVVTGPALSDSDVMATVANRSVGRKSA